MRSQRIFDQVSHNPMPPLRRTWTLDRSILQPVSSAGIFRALEESIPDDRMILIEPPRMLVTSVVSKRRHMLPKNCQNSLQLRVPIQTCVILYSCGCIGTTSIWARVCLLSSVSYCMVREVSQEDNNA